MAEDTYQYQIKPLPAVPVIGDQATDASQIAVGPAQAIIGNLPPTGVTGPQIPTSTTGGGGGGTTPTCATNWDIGTINTSTINLPCSGGVAIIDQGVIGLQALSGNTAELSATNARLIMSSPGGGYIQFSDGSGIWLNIDSGDYDAGNDVQIKLQELSVCHLGAPGFRKFVCGDAYS